MSNWEDIRSEWESSKTTLIALAERHDVKLGTLKSRKSRERWSRDPTEKDATITRDATKKTEKDATKKKRKKQKNRSGNPNPVKQFTERNSAAKTHGFFSKFIPAETLEIMGSLEERSPADLIWDQIQIQYAAIIRAQQIMFVGSKDEMVKELKKEKGSEFSTEEEYEIQFAWDRHANFMNAQSRAMSEFRSLIKQFNEMAYDDDERRLKLEQMKFGIDKTKAEVDKLTTGSNEGPIEIMIKRKGDG